MEKGPLQIESAAEVAKKVAFKHGAMLKRISQEAHHLFTDPVEVKDEDRLHGVGGILEKKLREVGALTETTSPQKKNRIIHAIEQKLEALGREKLKEMGFGSGTVRVIRTGEWLDLSILDEAGWIQAIR